MHMIAWQKKIHKSFLDKGYFDKPRSIPERLMGIVKQLGEAMNNYEEGFGVSSKGTPANLADATIQILNLCEYLDVDLETIMRERLK